MDGGMSNVDSCGYQDLRCRFRVSSWALIRRPEVCQALYGRALAADSKSAESPSGHVEAVRLGAFYACVHAGYVLLTWQNKQRTCAVDSCWSGTDGTWMVVMKCRTSASDTSEYEAYVLRGLQIGGLEFIYACVYIKMACRERC